ncbi:hypothetical protein cypCar_00022266 [Cyprinus carpio]|nr:hypothetical protein cypCar_00022266 [Cyprinus carpio]
MVSRGFYWTLWMLSCFGQYLGEVLQFSQPANGAVGGSVVFAPDNPPSTSIFTIQWHFETTVILTALSDSTAIFPAYRDRVSFDINTLALELRNLRLDDSGTYRLTVIPSAGDLLTGETSLQVFGECVAKNWFSIDHILYRPNSNSIIFSSDNRSVSISPVQRSDSGEYKCTYRNPVSSETAKLSLIITYGPEDVSIKGQDVVDSGVRVSLSCSANSEPSASFSWKFNGADTGVTTDTFTIDQTDFTHSGDYECTARNSVTKRSVSQKHTLLVKGSRKVINQRFSNLALKTCLKSVEEVKNFHRISKMGHKVLAIFFTLICAPGLYAVFLVPSKNPVAVGTNVTISVNDTGTITVGLWLFGPSTLFMWYQGNMIQGTSLQNGTEFNNSTYQLTLSSVTLRNSGLYVLEAFTPIKARAEMTLDVQEPVSNVTSFVNMTNLVEFNDTVTFTCNASGTPLWFSWQNRSSIVTAGGRVELRNGGRELFINGVMRYDEGPFKCLVENNISKVETNQTNLNISYGPSNLTVTALPEKEAYISGSDIFLSCSADSKPTASFYWMYNGIHLNVSGSSYNLRNTTQNISGQYACVAKNAVTLRSVAVIKNIKVVDPILSVTVNPAGSPVEGNAFNLSCNVVGPVDSIHWMKNGTYLGANDMITFFNNNSTLSFYRLGLSDDGLYQCAASNAVSNITSKAYNLMVNYGPWNTTMSGPIVGVVGQNVTFSCSADSHPPSRYSWFLNVTKVGEGPVLTRALSPDSGGRYTCMASNEITGSSSNVSLELTLI